MPTEIPSNPLKRDSRVIEKINVLHIRYITGVKYLKTRHIGVHPF